MASDPGYHFHAPGLPSRRGVIDVGLKCPHNCSMCFYRFLDDLPEFEGMQRASWHTREHLFGLVDSLAENGFISADITGGEPTLHPDIVPLIRHATEKGLATRIITLGQFLVRPTMGTGQAMLIDALLEAGLTDFQFSVHHTDEARFRAMTGGSWAKLEKALFYLDALDFQYATNTTITESNYRFAPEIARALARHNVYRSTISFALTERRKTDQLKDIQVRYSEAGPFVREAVAILEDAAISVTVRHAPICTVRGLDKNLVTAMGARYHPDEWMNEVNHLARPESVTPKITNEMGQPIQLTRRPHTDLMQVQGNINGVELVMTRGTPTAIGKVFPATCAKCGALNLCDGIDAQYIEMFGSDGLVPYFDDKHDQTIWRDRCINYASFFQKHTAKADIKSAIRRVMKPTRSGRDCSEASYASRFHRQISMAFDRIINPADPVKNPKVSVVVTCFNYGRYLDECLDSVNEQTYRNVETIIVDDASTDGSIAIAKKWREKRRRPDVLVVPRETNAGQPAPCRNQGIRLSSGDVICCLDADDLIAPTYLKEAVHLLQRNPQASLVYPATRIFGDKEGQWYAPPWNPAEFIMHNSIACAAVFKREVWEATGGYPENVRGLEDWALWIKAIGLGFIGVPLTRALFQYRTQPHGIFRTDGVKTHEEKYRQIVIDNWRLFPASMVKAARNGEPMTRRFE